MGDGINLSDVTTNLLTGYIANFISHFVLKAKEAFFTWGNIDSPGQQFIILYFQE